MTLMKDQASSETSDRDVNDVCRKFVKTWVCAAEAGGQPPRPIDWLDPWYGHPHFEIVFSRLLYLDLEARRRYFGKAPGFVAYWKQYPAAPKPAASYIAALCRYFGLPAPEDVLGPGEVLTPGEARGQSYKLVEVIGAGGQAVIFRAVEVNGNDRSEVAVKVSQADAAWDDAHRKETINALRLRVRHEVEITRKLHDPGIVPIFDYRFDAGGQEPGFAVMPLVPKGRSLDERLGGRRIGPTEAADLIRKLAWTIHRLHEYGVVHRDLKPGNILMHDFGPLVCDFGLAKRVGCGPIEPGGTPHYMAPEAARGVIDAKSDVFALAAMLFEMVTGHPPFTSWSHPDGTLMAVRHHAERAKRSRFQLACHLPLIDRVLKKIILDGLDSNSEQRPDASVLAARLDRYLGSTYWHPITYIKRRPFLASATALTTALASGKIGWDYWSADRELDTIRSRYRESWKAEPGILIEQLSQHRVGDERTRRRLAKELIDDGFLALNSDYLALSWKDHVRIGKLTKGPTPLYTDDELTILCDSIFFDLRDYRPAAPGVVAGPVRVTEVVKLIKRPGKRGLVYRARYRTLSQFQDSFRFHCVNIDASKWTLSNVQDENRKDHTYEIAVSLDGEWPSEVITLVFHVSYCGGFDDTTSGRWAGIKLCGPILLGQLGVLLPRGRTVASSWIPRQYRDEGDEHLKLIDQPDAGELGFVGQTAMLNHNRCFVWTVGKHNYPNDLAPPYLYAVAWEYSRPFNPVIPNNPSLSPHR